MPTGLRDGPRRRLPAPAAASRYVSFKDRVYTLLSLVPRGKVVTYGQLALLAGLPRGARQVGWLAHAGHPGLPWQRVVNRFGGLASGYRGGRSEQKKALARDGVRTREDFTVDLARYQWWPGEDVNRNLASPENRDEPRRKIWRRGTSGWRNPSGRIVRCASWYGAG